MNEWMKTRQTRYTLYAGVYIALVVAILAIANFLANRYNKSFDSTSNKFYSLSPQTEKVVKNLKDDVRITYFDKGDQFRAARDLLERYATLSPKVKVEYIDPDKKPTLAKEAQVKNYGAIYVQSGSRREEAKSLTEEEVTGAIIRTQKGDARTVCFNAGSGEKDLESNERTGYARAKEVIERNNYKVETIELVQKPEVPKNCTILVIAGPKYEYVEPAVNAIKSYVESGGRALFLMDPPLQFSQSPTSPNEGLASVLSSWGVTLNKDLALDQSPIGQLAGFNALVPLVSRYENHAIVREMARVATAFPVSRSLEVKNGEKTTVEKLFSTSEEAFSSTDLNSPEITIDPRRSKQGALTLAAAGIYNTGSEEKGRFVVVGSSSWLENRIINFNGNRDLLLNMLNWLSADEDLISIRPKEQEDRRITLNRSQMRFVTLWSMVVLPLAMVITGLAVWWRRR
jgi:ABC-type uncharacterized transport system involved in gliding motility auxiliary subunit